MPLMQRLILSDRTGFDYEYMEYPEFEFGATTRGKMAIAECFVDDEITAVKTMLSFYTQNHMGRRTYELPFEALILTTKEHAEQIGERYAIRCDRCVARSNAGHVVGWLHVWGKNDEDMLPMMVIKAGPAFISRVNLFFQDAIKTVKCDRLLSLEQEPAEDETAE